MKEPGLRRADSGDGSSQPRGRRFRVGAASALALALLCVFASQCRRPTVFLSPRDPAAAEALAPSPDGCALLPGEQAVVLDEDIHVEAVAADRITIVQRRRWRFAEGAMHGLPTLSYTWRPTRGETLRIDRAVAVDPDGLGVRIFQAERVPLTPSEARADPDAVQTRLRALLPDGGAMLVDVTRTVTATPSLPGVSAAVLTTAPYRRCRVAVRIDAPAALRLHQRMGFEPGEYASRQDAGEQRDEIRIQHIMLTMIEARDTPGTLMSISTVAGWPSLAASLAAGFRAGLPAPPASARTSAAYNTVATRASAVLSALARRASACPRRARDAHDGLFPQDPALTLAHGCGPCRDLAALAAGGLAAAGLAPWLVFVDPAQDLDPDFPADQLPHVLVGLRDGAAWILADPTVSPTPDVYSPGLAGRRALAVSLDLKTGPESLFLHIPPPKTADQIPVETQQSRHEATRAAPPDLHESHRVQRATLASGVNGVALESVVTLQHDPDAAGLALANLGRSDESVQRSVELLRDGAWSPMPETYLVPWGDGPGLLRPDRGLLLPLTVARHADGLRITVRRQIPDPLAVRLRALREPIPSSREVNVDLGLIGDSGFRMVDQRNGVELAGHPGGGMLRLAIARGVTPVLLRRDWDAARRWRPSAGQEPWVAGYRAGMNFLLSLTGMAGAVTSRTDAVDDPLKTALLAGDSWPLLSAAGRSGLVDPVLTLPCANADCSRVGAPTLARAALAARSVEESGPTLLGPQCLRFDEAAASSVQVLSWPSGAQDADGPQRRTLRRDDATSAGVDVAYELRLERDGTLRGVARVRWGASAACVVSDASGLVPIRYRPAPHARRGDLRLPIHRAAVLIETDAGKRTAWGVRMPGPCRNCRAWPAGGGEMDVSLRLNVPPSCRIEDRPAVSRQRHDAFEREERRTISDGYCQVRRTVRFSIFSPAVGHALAEPAQIVVRCDQ